MVRITEVGPRDGLQNEKIPISTDVKVDFINRLVNAGLRDIEATSFVSPKWVPQMADADALWPQLPIGAKFSALVPNVRGLERAMSVGVQRIALFTAASELFTRHNINMSIDESVAVGLEVIQAFRSTVPVGQVRGYVSTIFECPYAGRIQIAEVLSVVAKLFDAGVDEVSLGDTIGVGSTRETSDLGTRVLGEFGTDRIVWHFHDTNGGAIANIAEAMELGFNAFDSSAAGLGGCPYAPGAAGNVATEDLVYFCERNGVDTGVNLEVLAQASLPVLAALGRSPLAKAQVAALSRLSST